MAIPNKQLRDLYERQYRHISYIQNFVSNAKQTCAAADCTPVHVRSKLEQLACYWLQFDKAHELLWQNRTQVIELYPETDYFSSDPYLMVADWVVQAKSHLSSWLPPPNLDCELHDQSNLGISTNIHLRKSIVNHIDELDLSTAQTISKPKSSSSSSQQSPNISSCNFLIPSSSIPLSGNVTNTAAPNASVSVTCCCRSKQQQSIVVRPTDSFCSFSTSSSSKSNPGNAAHTVALKSSANDTCCGCSKQQQSMVASPIFVVDNQKHRSELNKQHRLCSNWYRGYNSEPRCAPQVTIDTSFSEQLRQVWEVGEVSCESHSINLDNQRCKKHAESTTFHHRIVQLPFAQSPDMSLTHDHRNIAVANLLRSERRHHGDRSKDEARKKLIQKLQDWKHMQRVITSTLSSSAVHKPHLAVFRPQGNNTRVIDNASQQFGNRYWWNDFVLVGLKFQTDIAVIWNRWRTFKFRRRQGGNSIVSTSFSQAHLTANRSWRRKDVATTSRKIETVNNINIEIGLKESALEGAATSEGASPAGVVAAAAAAAAGNLPVTPSATHITAMERLNDNDAEKAGPLLDGCNIHLAGFSSNYRDEQNRILNDGSATRLDGISDALTRVTIDDSTKATEDNFSIDVKDSKNQAAPEPPSPLSKPVNDEHSEIVQQHLQNTVSEPDTTLREELELPNNNNSGNGTTSQEHQTVRERWESSKRVNRPSINSVTREDSAIPISQESFVSQKIFQGLNFVITGFNDAEYAEYVEHIQGLGGEIAGSNYTGIPDYGIVPIFGAQLRRTVGEIVSDLFIEDCIDNEKLVEVSYYHRPIIIPPAVKPLKLCVISISTYIGVEGTYLLSLAEKLGARYQDMFSRKTRLNCSGNCLRSTHLICPLPQGEMYNAAVKWRRPAVTANWLLRCASERKLVDETHFLVGETMAPEAYLEGVAAAGAGAGAPLGVAVAGGQNIITSSIRGVITKRLLESEQTTPHYYLTIDVRMDEALQTRQQFNEKFEKEVSVNDLIIKGMAMACKKVPEGNSAWLEDKIRQYDHVDVRVAVSIDNGLITPIIFEADSKGIAQISAEVKALAAKAREGKLQPSEFQGGTITVFERGMFRFETFEAIMYPPQSIILEIGTIEEKSIPAGNENGSVTANYMFVRALCDHRTVDKAVGKQWLTAFKNFMEKPDNASVNSLNANGKL